MKEALATAMGCIGSRRATSAMVDREANGRQEEDSEKIKN